MLFKKVRKIIFAILLVTICSINFDSVYSKKIEIAPPHIDFDLTRFHFHKFNPQNKLGYGKDKYLIVSGGYPTAVFDMEGNMLKKWNLSSARAKLQENCHLFHIDHQVNEENIFDRNTLLEEYDENGERVWYLNEKGFAHHDFDFTDDGHIVLLYSIDFPEDFELWNKCSHDQVVGNTILEIDKKGNEYLRWKFYDHFPEVVNRNWCTENRLNRIKNNPYIQKLDPIHPDGLEILKDNKWYRKGYKEFKPGNLLITTQNTSTVFILDKESHRVVWVYKGEKDEPLNGPHEAKMIADGLPGAGNILIYDNGNNWHARGYSRILEIHPINKKTVWSYENPGKFFNEYAGTQQRLKDGNTFIGAGFRKRAFIVNKKGEIIWQWVDKRRHMKRPMLVSKEKFAHCLKD